MLYLDSKRFIGRQFNDDSVQNDMKSWPFAVVDEKAYFWQLYFK